MPTFLDLSFTLFCCWVSGFFGGLLFVLPFLAVKNIADVSAAAAGEIRGA